MNTELDSKLALLEMAPPSELGQPPTSAPAPAPPAVEEPRPKRAASLLKQAAQIILLVTLATGSYLFISRCVLQSVQVVGASMNPTLHDSDRYFLNRWAYRLHPPQHKDIVVLKDPTDGVFAVKRIVATPGEAIYFKQGEIFLNGVRLNEPYLANGTRTLSCLNADEALILCGENQYFVLGDNRGNSFDSRIYGPVRRQNIVGAIIR